MVRMGVVVFALVVVARATAVAAYASTKASALPPCSHLWSSKLSKYFDVGQLKFEGVTPRSDICTWFGAGRGHYHAQLQIGFSPASKSLFDTVTTSAEKSAKRQGATLSIVQKSSPGRMKRGGASVIARPTTAPSSAIPACTRWSS
jgi:hypothetical protein